VSVELFDSPSLSEFAGERVLAVADPFNDRIFFADWIEFLVELVTRTITHESLHIVLYRIAGLEASQALDILERDHLMPTNLEGF
jgi:hypothetical protein